MNIVSFNDFSKVEIRVGTIIDVKEFKEAIKPAYKIWVDFGKEIGIKKSSAQITDLYTKDNLINKKIIGVINLGEKQVGPFVSEFLCSGFYQDDGAVVLAVPDKEVPNGVRLC